MAIQISGGSVVEGGGSLSFEISLTAESINPVSVNFRSLSGSALERVDFAALGGVLTFAPGETTKTVSVDISRFSTGADTLAETDEAFVLELFDPQGDSFEGGAPVARATGFILDDDGGGGDLAAFVMSPVLEEGAGTARFEVRLSREPASAIVIPWETVDVSARAGSDYAPGSGVLSFSAAQTVDFIDVAVIDDGAVETAESFGVRLSPPETIANRDRGIVGYATLLDDDATPPMISVSAADGPAVEGVSVMEFVVTLSKASINPVTVNYRTLSGTALERVDFAAVGDALTFAPGETTKTVSINISRFSTGADSIDETDEFVVLELFEPGGAILDGGLPVARATGVILDNDGVGANLAAFVSSPVLLEGTGGTKLARFEVTLSQASAATLTIPWRTVDGSARAGSDYAAASGALTFAPGETRAFVDVVVTGDGVSEAAETFSVVLSPPDAIANRGSGLVGTATLLDDDATPPMISVSAADGPAVEGVSVMEFVVTLSKASINPVTVNYRTLSGTALERVDFAAVGDALTFAPGETTKTVSINISRFSTGADNVDETDEFVVLELFDPEGAILDGGLPVTRATGVILDDDGVGANLAAFVSSPVLLEGTGGTKLARFEVTLSQAANGTITIPWETVDVSARAGRDYTAASGTLTFTPGETRAFVDVAVTGDGVSEAAEVFGVRLSPTDAIANRGSGLVGYATLLDDDATPPMISVSAADGPAVEGVSVMEFVVTLSKAAIDPVTVNYRTLSGTALERVDFAAVGDALTFAPGETTKTVSINISRFSTGADSIEETDEFVVLELFEPEGAILDGGLPVTRATGVILDDDGVGANLAAFVSSPVLLEGTGGAKLARFEVTLSQAANGTITIPWETVDVSARAGSDYTAASGALTFAPGETRAFVDVVVAGDGVSEAAETFSVVLSPPDAIANRGSGLVGTATLLDDDDGQPMISVSAAEGPAVEGVSVLEFVVTLSKPSTQPVTVQYRNAGGTAEAGVDYSAIEGELSFAPGETTKTLTIDVTRFRTGADNEDETDEAVVLELFEPEGAVLDGRLPVARATGFILDNDGVGSNLALFASNPVVVEGQSGADRIARFEVKLSQAANGEIVVPFSTTDGTALAGRDYIARSGAVTFAPGQTQAFVDVAVLGDLLKEPSRQFGLVLTPPPVVPSGASGARPIATVIDNDIFTILGRDIGDVLRGGAQSDVIGALGGNDFLSGGAAADTLDGGDGFDTVDYSVEGGSQRIVANLRAGVATDSFGATDTLISIERVVGGPRGDIFVGDSGSGDIFVGGAGADTMNGGAGNDVVDYSRETGSRGVTVNLRDGAAIDTFGDRDTLQLIESALGTSRADVFVGGTGSERFTGLRGNDVINGGLGFDFVDYGREAGPRGVIVNLGTGVGIDTFGTRDRLIGIEAVTGTARADFVVGGNGIDRFEGAGGDDVFRSGGRSGDVFIGGDGLDTIDYSTEGGPRGVVVNLAAGSAIDSFGSRDAVFQTEAVLGTRSADLLVGRPDSLLSGLAGADTLRGGVADYSHDADNGGGGRVIVNLRDGAAIDGFGGRDALVDLAGAAGTAGDDIFVGGDGAERYHGLDGADTIAGGAGFDFADYSREGGAARGVIVNLGAGAAIDGSGARDVLSGIEGVTGSDGGDLLIGSDRVDRLEGGAGADTVRGAGGNDVLLGGADADRFVYDATGWGVDVIMDWTDGVDRLVFDGVTEVQGIADLAPAQSGANTVLSLGDDRIILAGAAFATVTDADLLII